MFDCTSISTAKLISFTVRFECVCVCVCGCFEYVER